MGCLAFAVGSLVVLVLFLPALLAVPPRPLPGEAWIATLDVGQGLAVLVRTAEHALLFDAGPAYGSDSDSGGEKDKDWTAVNLTDVCLYPGGSEFRFFFPPQRKQILK